MNTVKKIRKYDYMSSCMFYLCAILVNLICQALVAFLSAALESSVPGIASNATFNTAFMIFIQLAYCGFIFLYTKLCGYKFNFAFFKREGEERAPDAPSFIVPVLSAGLLLVAMYLPTVWYGYFTRYALGIPPTYGNIDISGNVGATVMIVVASVFMAPVFEEIIYRGVLFNGLKSERGALKAAFISAAAFMLMHLSPVQVVFQFSLGLVGAFIVHKSGRLFPSMLMHATANSLALVMQLTPLSGMLGSAETWLVSNPAAAVFITLGLLAAGGAGLFFLVKYGFDLSKDKRGESAEPEGGDDGADDEEQQRVRTLRRRDGNFRLYIGLGICAVLLIINLVVAVV